uniref:Phytocyanin domain-containing protein n=1 Tax=Kalanchoe fedtschenkoi TaxID=63787 RepID=A0A7N0ZWK3_KALFE
MSSSLGASPSTGLFMVAMLALLSLSSASYFEVGGKDGWTSSKNVNYTSWADGYHFQVGDVLRFVYDNKKENVLRLSQRHYSTCNLTDPVKKWTSGNDSVRLQRAGHFFFISSPDGQCQGKARVNVKVYPNDEAGGHSPSPAPTPVGSSSSAVPAPEPKPAAAVSVKASWVGCIIIMPLLLLIFPLN